MKIRRTSIIILLYIANVQYAAAQQTLKLYNDSIPNSIGSPVGDEVPSIISYLPKPEKATGTAVVIFPGGAYGTVVVKEEGTKVAEAFADRGIAAFVVKYRLPKRETMVNKTTGPLMDAQQAMKVVRERAAEWKIDPKKIGVVGYSAGGHLASTLGTHYIKSLIKNPSNTSLRPDFIILVYPVISMTGDLTHIGSRINLLGVEPDSALVTLYSNEEQVTKDTPPTYLTHCGDDQVVDVNNSIVFYQALQRNGVNAELHLYPKGDHGFTQRLPVAEWLDPMLVWMKGLGFLSK